MNKTETFNKFINFIENTSFKVLKEENKYSYTYEYDKLESLIFETWKLENENQEISYLYFRLKHEGLTLNEILSKIENNESYEVLVSLYGDYKLINRGMDIYLNLKEHKDFIFKKLKDSTNLGGLIINFLDKYLEHNKYFLTPHIKNIFYNQFCKDYKFYIKDMDLDKEFEDKYQVGDILHDKRKFYTSDMVGKLNKTHRFLILSTHMGEYESDFDFETFRTECDHFLVLDKFQYDDYCQIALLHLPPKLWQVFKYESFNLDALVEDSRNLLKESFKEDTVEVLEESSWINNTKFPLGLDENGDFNSPFYTVYEDGYSKGVSDLSLNMKLDITYRLLNYNYPELKEAKFPAPKWLVYPELNSGSMGWRMGYGEEYNINFYSAKFNYNEFEKLFPEPLNWCLKYDKEFKENIGNILPYYAIGWNKTGSPKYNLLNTKLDAEDIIYFKDIFSSSLIDDEFRITAEHFDNFKDAMESSKNKMDFKDLNKNLQERLWGKTRYTVCLNLLYFRIFPYKNLRDALLETGDKPIVFKSKDPYWGVRIENGEYEGFNNFGFALMELRDEIKRLYKNNEYIDWFYTEFLKTAPYDFNKYSNDAEDESLINLNNKQSPEYKIYEATYNDCKVYIRDLNISAEIEKKYKVGKIIQERAFVDTSNKIGAVLTSHRITILSNHFTDISKFEEGTDWGLHICSANSIFKVLDVYKYQDKTQILLLHLIDGFWEIFEDDKTIKEECVNKARALFEESFKREPIESLNTETWLKRCEFPIGLDSNGEYWEIE